MGFGLRLMAIFGAPFPPGLCVLLGQDFASHPPTHPAPPAMGGWDAFGSGPGMGGWNYPFWLNFAALHVFLLGVCLRHFLGNDFLLHLQGASEGRVLLHACCVCVWEAPAWDAFLD